MEARNFMLLIGEIGRRTTQYRSTFAAKWTVETALNWSRV